MLNEKQKKIIGDELGKRINKLICPMCQNNNFILAEGYFNNSMQSDISNFSIGGPNIPTVAILCNHCGFFSQHALGVLGFLPKDDDKKIDKPDQ